MISFINDVILNLLIIILATFVALWFLLSVETTAHLPTYCFKSLTRDNKIKINKTKEKNKKNKRKVINLTSSKEKIIAKIIFTIMFLSLYIVPIVIKIIKPIFKKDYNGVNKTKEKRIEEVKAGFQVFKEQLIFSLFSYFVVMFFSF